MSPPSHSGAKLPHSVGMKTLGRRLDREPLDQAVAFSADELLEEDGAELGERLRRRVVQRPDHGLPLEDVECEHAHLTAVGGLEPVGGRVGGADEAGELEHLGAGDREAGDEVGRFLRSLRWSDKSQNTLDTYEIVLARLAYDHAHFKSLDEFTTEALRDFLDEHWGDSSPATRRNRLAIVKSFFRWAADERGLAANPADGSSRRRRPRSSGRRTRPT